MASPMIRHTIVIIVAICVALLSYINHLRGEVDMIAYTLAKVSLQVFPTTFPRNDTTDPAKWRARFKAVSTLNFGPKIDLEVEDVLHDGVVPGNFKLLRIYNGNTGFNSPKRDVLIFYHGGGFVLGGVEENDEMCRLFAKHTNYVVVSVEYSLAPEFPYPRGFDDAMAALTWVKHNIGRYGGHNQRIFLSGESAGGNLALAVCARNLDLNVTHIDDKANVIGALFIYPATTSDFTLPSYTKYANYNGILTTENVKHVHNLYSAGMPCTEEEYTCLPIHTPIYTLANFPSVEFVIAEYDVLRDDSLRMIERMEEFIVPVGVSIYPSIHGFFGRALFPHGLKSIEIASNRLLDISRQTHYPAQEF